MINEAGLPLIEADGLINEAVATEETGIKQIDKVAETLAQKQKAKGVSLAEDTIADAAKNMGLSTVAGVNTLYDAGYENSIELKGRGGENVEIGTVVSVAFSASVGNKCELGKAMPSEKNARNAN